MNNVGGHVCLSFSLSATVGPEADGCHISRPHAFDIILFNPAQILVLRSQILFAVAQSVQRQAMAGRPGFISLQGQNCSLLQVVHTGSWAQPASYSTGREGSFPVGKAAGT
jgi:hypothetical protein